MDAQSLNYVIGGLIVANLGTIGSILVYGGKFIWWMSKIDSRVLEAEKDITAAHAAIRTITKET